MNEANAMTEAAPFRLDSWTVPQAQLFIEYSFQTIEELHSYALDGLRHISRGGVEVGGILFGARRDNLVRILTWRPIPCEHAKGPSFVLSQKDRIGLGNLLQNSRADPGLMDMEVLGWFVSHTRSGISLTDADLNVYNHFFPWSWQVTLVLHPQRDESPSPAGFFFRDSDGEVKADSSYREFLLEPPSAAIDRPGIHPVIAEHGPTVLEPEQPQPVMRRPTPPPPTPLPVAVAPAAPGVLNDRRLWIWAVPALLALLVAAMLLEKPAPTAAPTIGFHAVDSGGILHLDWDGRSEPIQKAVRGSLDVKESGSNAPALHLPLRLEQLRLGTLSYPHKPADLEILMSVYPASGPPVQESARFVGVPVNEATPAPQPTGLPDETRAENLRLRKDVGRLRDELRRAENRNRELEDAVRILNQRVKVDELRIAK